MTDDSSQSSPSSLLSPSSPYDLIIFDCDGVLVDSERLAVQHDVAVFAEYGWPLSAREIIDRYVGRSYEFLTSELAAAVGGLPEDFHETYDRGLQALFEAELTAVDGVEKVIDAVEAAGIPMCVASSSTHDRLRFSLGLTGLYDRFAGRIFSATEVENGKPAPDLFLHAAAKMGAEPARCAVIEDSEFGVLAARAAGMNVYAYASGLVSVERLDGPRTVQFTDMRELPELLGLPAGL